jgi:cytochrome c-type biogenesis protein
VNGVLLPFAAVAAGLVSATSPCVLPVLPGYLAAVSSADAARADGRFRPSIVGAVGFVAGFTAIFTVLGATASAIGGLLFSRLDVALDIAGALLIVLGLHSVGAFRMMKLSGERRPVGFERIGRGPRRSVALGAVFALGWTPCIGPILATILTKAAADASLPEGMLLLLLYSTGLGMPFIALAVWFDRSARIRAWLARRALMLQRVGGVAMIAIGLAYISGVWSTIFTGVQRWLARTGWPPI